MLYFKCRLSASTAPRSAKKPWVATDRRSSGHLDGRVAVLVPPRKFYLLLSKDISSHDCFATGQLRSGAFWALARSACRAACS